MQCEITLLSDARRYLKESSFLKVFRLRALVFVSTELRWNDTERGKSKYSEKNLFYSRFVNYEFNFN
jgi:hypothetical protein